MFRSRIKILSYMVFWKLWNFFELHTNRVSLAFWCPTVYLEIRHFSYESMSQQRASPLPQCTILQLVILAMCILVR